MNLPTLLTVGRIAATPLIAVLPFADSWTARLAAFVLFTTAAGARPPAGHVTVALSSVTVTGPGSVTLPVFSTR